MIERVLQTVKRLIPKGLFEALAPVYHYKLALLAALWYRFPSREIQVVAVTGTKGKSSTAEIINAILEEAGYKTALSSTIRFKVGERSEPNGLKMTMPGRFFMQRFLRQAADEGCHWAIIEMTSEGTRQFRHKFIDLDALVVTNIAPEHIEAHGSFEKYLEAKLKIARQLERSRKPNKTLIVNSDDRTLQVFMRTEVPNKILYGLAQAPHFVHRTRLPGEFNKYNVLAAATFARHIGIKDEVVARAIDKLEGVPGRMQFIKAGQNFNVVVDYAHTPDSLEKVYQTLKGAGKLICVLGGTGGGRDKWKRPLMGGIADKYCSHIILTDEDPYDEDPQRIVDEISRGIKDKEKVEIIMDRRNAIARAKTLAREGDTVIITGKGTDPYIMGPRGSKVPWSDASVSREELAKTI